MSILFHSIQNRKKRPLDLHDLLVGDENATFFVRIRGNSSEALGVHDKDILVVDRSRIAHSHALYVAVSDGDFVLVNKSGIAQGMQLWGAVTYVIHPA